MAARPSFTLAYADDGDPGITRERRGKQFRYRNAKGELIDDPAEIARLNAVALPPAYEKCWFCPDPAGHIQATGYDARGRKQYRYHLEFRADREADKFAHCAEFGAALPLVRARVEQALQSRVVSKERTLAALVRLLDIGMIRVGNDRYAQDNGSFGATTLRMRHADLKAGRLHLSYRGKSGQVQSITVQDKGLLRFVRTMQDLPGQRLFQYVDEVGTRHEVGSSDVNAFIQESMGNGFSAKNFRTWGGTLVAFTALVHSGGAISIKSAMEQVASALGNTPAISRKSYVHPAVIEAIKRSEGEKLVLPPLPRSTRWHSREERGLIAFLNKPNA